MVKEFHYRGFTEMELKKMSIEEIARLLPSKERRTLKRGLTEPEKKLLGNVRESPEKFHKTHLREMIILPEMIGQRFGIYIGGAKAADTGGRWANLVITPEMIGKRLGDFAVSIKRVKHSAPGIGASKSSKHIAMK
jgi:small subunit ribosomal protein S19